MRMTARFQNGVRSDVVLLAAAGMKIRVVVAGRGTTEEWLSIRGQCYDERGRAVEIESAVPIAGVDYRRLVNPVRAASGSAGN